MNGLDCVEFQGFRDKDGYGKITKGKSNFLAHRLSYAESRGLDLSEINGLLVRHSCDNPACVNPGHLQVGTHADNMRDKVERGRASRLQGESHPRAKLKETQVSEIRRRYQSRSDKDGTRALAAEFGVSRSLIWHIVSNKLWTQS